MTKSIFEQMGGTYRQEGDYLIPNIELPESKPIGKYGRMHDEYLKNNFPCYRSTLLIKGKLSDYLYDIDTRAKEMVESIIKSMAEKQGITEKLKAENQFLWIGKMENIKHSAEEIVLSEIVYTTEGFDK